MEMEKNYSREDDKFNFDTSNELALSMGPSTAENRARLKNRFASKKNRQTTKDSYAMRRMEASAAAAMKTSPRHNMPTEESKELPFDEHQSVEFEEVSQG
jgi:hypothetical protein